MSAKTFDLAEIEQDARDDYVMRRADTLALVRVARAAIVVAADPLSTDAVRRLDAALAPFTDSAESDKRGAQGAEQREGRCDGE